MPLIETFSRDADIGALFTCGQEIASILQFEQALATAQRQLDLMPDAAHDRIEQTLVSWKPPVEFIRFAFAEDGVPVPSLVRMLREAVGEPHARYVHMGATSQDAVDTGLMLRLKAVLDILDERLGALLQRHSELSQQYGAAALMAHTRMQAALPFTVADKLATWSQPLMHHRERLTHLRSTLPVQLGGPIGIGDSFGESYLHLRVILAKLLNLSDAAPWHGDRTPILDIAQAFMLLAGTLAKIGQDIALMAQTEVAAIRLSGGGSSSAMPHKQNPVAAEVMVTLGRLNAGLMGTLGQSMVSENERSGAAWTLEWIVLPQMAEAAGASLTLANELLAGAEFHFGT